MGKKPKKIPAANPLDVTRVQQFLLGGGTPAALSLQQSINRLLQANPNLSSAELVRILREEVVNDATLRGQRLDDLSGQANAFAEQLVQQARGGGVAGAAEPSARQLEFQFTPDTSRPLYIHPMPLPEAFEAAAEQGVPWGHDLLRLGWHNIERSPHMRSILDAPDSRDFLRTLQESLRGDGIPGAELVPHSMGASSTAFSVPGTQEIVKFTQRGENQYKTPAAGVWGVVAPRAIRTLERPEGLSDVTYGIFPEAVMGKAKSGDRRALAKALSDQGWEWYDQHDGNIGMLRGSEYRPVVVDTSDVYPQQEGWKKWPFRPPTGPLYNWLIPALAAGGAATIAGQQANAGEPATTQAGGLPAMDAEAAFFSPPQRYGYPAEQTTGSFAPPVVLAAGSRGTPVAQPTREFAQRPSTDFSMEISPAEWNYWYGGENTGYAGDTHLKFQEEVGRAMDLPTIPERYVTETLGIEPEMWDAFFPGYEGGDMSPRMLVERAPYWMLPRLGVQALQEQIDGKADGPYNRQLLAMTRPEGANQLVQDTVAEFSGLKRDRSLPAASDLAGVVLSGLSSGVSGAPFADRDEVTRGEDKRLRQSFSKDGTSRDAEMYVTKGGANNYRREATLQFLRTLQDGQFAPPGVTSMDWLGNHLFDQTVGNMQRVAGEEYNPQDVWGFGRAGWRASNLMDASAPRGRMELALDTRSRTPRWATKSPQQLASEESIRMDLAPYFADNQQASGAWPGSLAASSPSAAQSARQDGYSRVIPEGFDRFSTGTYAGLSNVLYNNQSFAPAQYAQWFDPLFGQVHDKLAAGEDGGWSGSELLGISPSDGSNRVEALGGGAGAFTRQMGRDIDSIRPVRGDRETPDHFDRRRNWYADKKQADREYRSAYWGPALADAGNYFLGGNATTGKPFERSFLSPTAESFANLGQDFVRNPYNYPTVVGGSAGGALKGLAQGGLRGAASGAIKSGAMAVANEIADEGREEAAINAAGGMFDLSPQTNNAFARDFDAPKDKWVGGQPPQIDPQDPKYWEKFNNAWRQRQGLTAGFYDAYSRGLLD